MRNQGEMVLCPAYTFSAANGRVLSLPVVHRVLPYP